MSRRGGVSQGINDRNRLPQASTGVTARRNVAPAGVGGEGVLKRSSDTAASASNLGRNAVEMWFKLGLMTGELLRV